MLSVKAILARFDGSKQQAIEYCRTMIAEYPRLRQEYRAYLNVLEAL